MCRTPLLCLIATVCVLLASPVSAEPIYELTLSGTVSSVTAAPAFQADFDNEFSVGEAFSFVVVYDGGSAVTGGVGNTNIYDNAIQSFTGTIGDYAVNAPGSALTRLQLVNHVSYSGILGDHFIVSAETEVAPDVLGDPLGGPIAGTVPYALAWVLSDSTDTLFPDPPISLPPPLSTAFDLGLIDTITSTYLYFYDPLTNDDSACELRFDITGISLQLIPELVGDLDSDGFVGIADLNIVLGNWNQNVTPSELLLGDPSGDGFVGIEDLNAVLGNWNAGTPPLDGAPVPEPTSGLLLLGGSGVLCALRRRVC